jgi:hypothetical protein
MKTDKERIDGKVESDREGGGREGRRKRKRR